MVNNDFFNFVIVMKTSISILLAILGIGVAHVLDHLCTKFLTVVNLV